MVIDVRSAPTERRRLCREKREDFGTLASSRLVGDFRAIGAIPTGKQVEINGFSLNLPAFKNVSVRAELASFLLAGLIEGAVVHK